MLKETLIKKYIQPLVPIPTGMTPLGLSRISGIKIMLFDVYGTLLISEPDVIHFLNGRINQEDSLTSLLRRYNIDQKPSHLVRSLHQTIERSHDKLRQQGVDHPEVDIVEIWHETLGISDTSRVKTFALEYEMILNPVYPMPGLKRLTSYCSNNRIGMGIISNAQFYTPFLLEQILGSSLPKCGFDPNLLFFSYHFKCAKPSTLMFESAARMLSQQDFSPSSVIYVGNDMYNDIKPAQSVGFQTALFAGDRRSLSLREDDPCCRNLKPDVILTDLRQLILHHDRQQTGNQHG